MSPLLVALLTLLLPAAVLAQTSFPTEFPPDSVAPDAAALKQLLTGRTFVVKPVEGAPFRIQYKESYVYFNSGSTRDTGRWRTEGSSICVEWQTFRASCSEARIAGPVVYVKRANNGEVVRLEAQ